jgi:Domain of unknown function (DUF4253)
MASVPVTAKAFPAVPHSQARIGVVSATRPADVLPLIGWFASDQFDDALPVAAVVRSWEDRFDATLLEVGFSQIRLLVRRPRAPSRRLCG